MRASSYTLALGFSSPRNFRIARACCLCVEASKDRVDGSRQFTSTKEDRFQNGRKCFLLALRLPSEIVLKPSFATHICKTNT